MGNNKRKERKDIKDEYSDYEPLFPFPSTLFRIFPPFNF